jgi:hypothetical protein
MQSVDKSIIAIDVIREEYLSANGFDVFVTIRGASFFTGNTAFEKAEEVKSLVEAIVAAGVPRSDVSLVGVRVDVESGFLAKSSSAHYSLRVRSNDCDKLSSVLSAVSSAKNVKIDALEWRYPEDEAAQQTWLRLAVADARGRANAIAEGLGLTITGVERVTTPISPATSRSTSSPGSEWGGRPGAPSLRRRTTEVDLGLEVAPMKRVDIEVHAEFAAQPIA